jgi:hypothetical protein
MVGVLGPSPVPTANSVHPKIIDDFQIWVKWVSEGQRPLETPLHVGPR